MTRHADVQMARRVGMLANDEKGGILRAVGIDVSLRLALSSSCATAAGTPVPPDERPCRSRLALPTPARRRKSAGSDSFVCHGVDGCCLRLGTARSLSARIRKILHQALKVVRRPANILHRLQHFRFVKRRDTATGANRRRVSLKFRRAAAVRVRSSRSNRRTSTRIYRRCGGDGPHRRRHIRHPDAR